jgi:hypothetical protein
MDAIYYLVAKFKESNIFKTAANIGPHRKIPERDLYPLAVKFKELPTSVEAFLGELASQFGVYEIQLPGDYKLSAAVKVKRERDLKTVTMTRHLKEFIIYEHGQIKYWDVQSSDGKVHHLHDCEEFFRMVDERNASNL